MAINTAPKYVTTADFKTQTGIDLYEQLAGEQSPTIFLANCEREIVNYVNLQSWRQINDKVYDEKFTDEQKDALALAIIQQAEYEYYNGNLFKNSGIDPEQGVKMTRDSMMNVAISQMAIDTLKMAGIVSLVMKAHW